MNEEILALARAEADALLSQMQSELKDKWSSVTVEIKGRVEDKLKEITQVAAKLASLRIQGAKDEAAVQERVLEHLKVQLKGLLGMGALELASKAEASFMSFLDGILSLVKNLPPRFFGA
jgi:predicted transcriptional regulator